MLLTIELPHGPGTKLTMANMLESYRDGRPEERMQRLGDAFVAAGEHLVCEVPSIVVPEESNLLINPIHPDASRVRLVSRRPIAFDARLR